jgi:RNA polymerase sigma factor for flagellar operon FliA
MSIEEVPHYTDFYEKEAALWAALKGVGAAAAREQLFSLHAKFARRVAKRHFLDRSGTGVELPDLCQMAYAGLLEAIDRFNPELGVHFEYFAERRIAGSILDGLRRTSEVREQISFRNRVRRERAKSLSISSTDKLTSAQALEQLVDAAVGLALSFMLEGTDIFVAEHAPDPRSNAYESVAWREALGRVRSGIQSLPDRERLIIEQHYFGGLDFDRLGALLSVTKGRVSQLHKAALLRLRSQLHAVGQFNLER